MYKRQRLDLPVHIYAGEEDSAAPPDNARRIFAELPNANKELTIYPHTGHEIDVYKRQRPGSPRQTMIPRISTSTPADPAIDRRMNQAIVLSSSLRRLWRSIS